MTELLSHFPTETIDDLVVEDFDGLLHCTRIEDITHDVRSFSFTLDHRSRLHFVPGQYVTLSVPVGDQLIDRCYTISSAPTRAAELTITVKRVPNGPVSNWLHDHLRVGDSLQGSGPYGVFSHDHHPTDDLVLLTAGSGITPAMSMLRTLRDRGANTRIHFLHSSRTPIDIIFRAELEEVATHQNVTVTVICEDDAADEIWHGPKGRLSAASLLAAAPTLLSSEVFTCGPAPYMAAVREMVALLGVDPARYHEESFNFGGSATDLLIGDLPTTEAPSIEDSTDGNKPGVQLTVTHQVEFRKSGKTVSCDASSSILAAAAGAGIPLPSSCGEGVCGTCKQDLLSGEVDMQHGGGIRPREIREGKVLLCSAKPCSDLVIDA